MLLLSREGGDEQMSRAHGLTEMNWKDQISNVKRRPTARDCLALKVKTGKGLFRDLVKITKNRIFIHEYEPPPGYWLEYAIPTCGHEISFIDVISKLPDILSDIATLSERPQYIRVVYIGYTGSEIEVTLASAPCDYFNEAYNGIGYRRIENTVYFNSSSPPSFIHSYISMIPRFSEHKVLYVVEPFADGAVYSQLCLTYAAAYFLGMLVRYYPTYWMSLIEGTKGDALWPAINRLQSYVETAYPEMVIEFIHGWMNPKIPSLSRTAP